MKDKTARKSALLSAIIDEYIRSAKPVSSSLIVDKYDFDVSPATVRNEMVVLEQEGLITHPHTSAGRIPTCQGWQFYVSSFLKEKKIIEKDKKVLKIALDADNLKEIAKTLAEMSGLAVFVGFTPDDSYYTGLSNLFKQPEFQQIDLVHSISEVVDHLEDTMPIMLEKAKQETSILLGSENPFGQDCGTVITKVKQSLVGVLGPVRMDYSNNFARLNYIQESLK